MPISAARRRSRGRSNGVGILTAEERAQIVAAFDAIRAEAADARVLRRRDRRGRPYARHPQAEGAGRRGSRTRSTPAAAATSRFRSIRGCGCARSATASAALLRGRDAGAARSGASVSGRRDSRAIRIMRRAQAVLWPHYLLAYFEMFARDWERFGEARARANVLPLGSGALAGSGFPFDREAIAQDLGFDGDHAQQHGRLRRPRFRARLPLCRHRRRCST